MIQRGIAEANHVRAAIRLPLDSTRQDGLRRVRQER